MNPDADDRDPMEKIDVRVPTAILEAIDEEYTQRGYTSRSEAIRDALRDWLNPSPKLSDEILDELQMSRDQREQGTTVSGSEIRDRVNLGDSVPQPRERRQENVSEDVVYLGREEGELEFTGTTDEVADRLQEKIEKLESAPLSDDVGERRDDMLEKLRDMKEELESAPNDALERLQEEKGKSESSE